MGWLPERQSCVGPSLARTEARRWKRTVRVWLGSSFTCAVFVDHQARVAGCTLPELWRLDRRVCYSCSDWVWWGGGMVGKVSLSTHSPGPAAAAWWGVGGWGWVGGRGCCNHGLLMLMISFLTSSSSLPCIN